MKNRRLKSFPFLGMQVALLLLLGACEKGQELLPEAPAGNATAEPIEGNESGQQEENCNEVIAFADPGMCGGLWFQIGQGAYLEVYGYPKSREDMDLEVGDEIEVSYEPYTFEGYMCMGMTSFEVELVQSGTPYKTVMLTCVSGNGKDPEPGDCSEQVVFANAGLCGGVWFQRPDGTYLEVYDYPFDRENPALEPGDEVTMDYEAYDPSGLIRCMAFNAFEENLYESGEPIEIVRTTCY